jgi:hypothetical protein
MRPGSGPPHRRWTNRSVAREVDRQRLRSIWGLVAAVALAASPLAFHALEKNECVGLSYELNRLRDEQERLTETARRLSMRRTAEESLDAAEAWVRTQDELVRPSPRQVSVLDRPAAMNQPKTAWARETVRGTRR